MGFVVAWFVAHALEKRLRRRLRPLWQELPQCLEKRLPVVDAGIASKQPVTLASDEVALLGRLRINVKLRCAPPSRQAKQRGRSKKHGAILHLGRVILEVKASAERYLESEKDEKGQTRQIRLRRWNALHDQDYPETLLDIVRVANSKVERPWLLASTAKELSREEFFQAYQMRTTIETNFAVGQDRCAMEQPRTFTEQAVTRRISLSLVSSSCLKAIAAKGAEGV